jgi:hypothetical protein
MGKRKPVFIDGRVSFGQPVVIEGVPTVTLHLAYLAELRGTADAVPASADRTIDQRIVRYIAEWYSIASPSVRAAIEYETRLAA